MKGEEHLNLILDLYKEYKSAKLVADKVSYKISKTEGNYSISPHQIRRIVKTHGKSKGVKLNHNPRYNRECNLHIKSWGFYETNKK